MALSIIALFGCLDGFARDGKVLESQSISQSQTGQNRPSITMPLSVAIMSSMGTDVCHRRIRRRHGRKEHPPPVPLIEPH